MAFWKSCAGIIFFISFCSTHSSSGFHQGQTWIWQNKLCESLCLTLRHYGAANVSFNVREKGEGNTQMLYIKARVQDQFWGKIVNIFSFFLSPQKVHRAAPSKLNAHFPIDNSTSDQYQQTEITFQ